MATETVRMPMFPLGTNVFPMQVLPLHIFEERYLQLMDDLLGGEPDDAVSPTFGVVMIERGSETGGGDVRAAVATRVEVLEAEQFEDGRWGVIVAGVERIDVVSWEADDPYPLAMVAVRERLDTGGGSLDELEGLLDRTLTIGAELVEAEAPDLSQLSSDPVERLDQMSAVAPLTTFDRQRVLEAATTAEQIQLLSEALTDKFEILESEQIRRASE